jgi:hypothetical protein
MMGKTSDDVLRKNNPGRTLRWRGHVDWHLVLAQIRIVMEEELVVIAAISCAFSITECHSLPHAVATEVDEALHALGPPLPAGLAGQVDPASLAVVSDTRGPDPSLDRFLGPWVVEERIRLMEALVVGVLLEHVRLDVRDHLAMHLSSGYTVGDDGNRYVFTMNTKRYPDFKGMVALYHNFAQIRPCREELLGDRLVGLSQTHSGG